MKAPSPCLPKVPLSSRLVETKEVMTPSSDLSPAGLPVEARPSIARRRLPPAPRALSPLPSLPSPSRLTATHILPLAIATITLPADGTIFERSGGRSERKIERRRERTRGSPGTIFERSGGRSAWRIERRRERTRRRPSDASDGDVGQSGIARRRRQLPLQQSE